MTTLIIDSHSGACDSLWSDSNGLKIAVPLKKYLFIPALGNFSNEQKTRIGAPKLIFYCGSFEQIVLHQAFSVGIINKSQYIQQAQNANLFGFNSFGYAEILLGRWEAIFHSGIQNDQGVLFGGSGGGYAFQNYLQCYNTKFAVETAIQLDKRSDFPVSSYCHLPVEGDYFENLMATGNEIVNIIYSLAERLIISMQTGERGGNMRDIKYSGCTTSASKEAPAIDIPKVVDEAQRSQQIILEKKKKKQQLAPKFQKDMDITANKVNFKTIET